MAERDSKDAEVVIVFVEVVIIFTKAIIIFVEVIIIFVEVPSSGVEMVIIFGDGHKSCGGEHGVKGGVRIKNGKNYKNFIPICRYVRIKL